MVPDSCVRIDVNCNVDKPLDEVSVSAMDVVTPAGIDDEAKVVANDCSEVTSLETGTASVEIDTVDNAAGVLDCIACVASPNADVSITANDVIGVVMSVVCSLISDVSCSVDMTSEISDISCACDSLIADGVSSNVEYVSVENVTSTESGV